MTGKTGSAIIHRAAKIREDGSVSAVCFERPRKIDLARASWTIIDGAVTCKKCLKIMLLSKSFDPEEQDETS